LRVVLKEIGMRPTRPEAVRRRPTSLGLGCVALCGWGLLVLGCELLPPRAATVLKPASQSLDSVAVEVFFLRCPLDDPELNDDLWNEIDELAISASTRRELLANGLRAGILGGRLPLVLEKRLELAPQPTLDSRPVEAKRNEPEVAQANALQLEQAPRVSGKYVQMPARKRSELQTTRVLDSMTVLLPKQGELIGGTYEKAQGIFAARVIPEELGRVKLELIPELHYGELTNRYTHGQDGMWVLQPSRDRLAFPQLQINASLAPGEMVVISCLPDRGGSVGQRFFTDEVDGRPEQKLLLIRLSQVRGDQLNVAP